MPSVRLGLWLLMSALPTKHHAIAMQQNEHTEDQQSELENRTTELEKHKVRVDEQTDQLRERMLRMSTSYPRERR